ncbi:MAG TPA: hypothetical protein PKY35_07980 [Candidatus Hydrogenedentes bacterium]|nr:hypothetical protein [Candidatus Hydrogenedentota bacterium]HOL76952.1 hypothetical protein [Candidatus Hydrogenedentota bacterium]HPO86659.1 hypothetical protein [Candidatus Hydrogenedentota bacterium]
MQYFRASQPIPGKGDAWVYYECTDDQKIVRQLTYIPATGEIDRVPDPIVKKLYKPEWLEPATQEDFCKLWDTK